MKIFIRALHKTLPDVNEIVNSDKEFQELSEKLIQDGYDVEHEIFEEINEIGV